MLTYLADDVSFDVVEISTVHAALCESTMLYKLVEWDVGEMKTWPHAGHKYLQLSYVPRWRLYHKKKDKSKMLLTHMVDNVSFLCCIHIHTSCSCL